MSRSIQDFLPNKGPTKKKVIQGRVPAEVVRDVKKIMDKENLSWADILTACLKHFLDEKAPRQ